MGDLNFANLYFDLNADGGQNLGFEIANERAFRPTTGTTIFGAVPGIEFARGLNSTGSSFEFSIPISAFNQRIAGVDYTATGQPLFNGGSVILRGSQSFGYSVAGGETFGPNRLAIFQVPSGVPEPTTWGMMLIGFGAVGYSMRGRNSRRRHALAAV